MGRFRAYSRSTSPAKHDTSSQANVRVAELVVKNQGSVSSAPKLAKMLGKDGKGKSRGGLSSAAKDRIKATFKKEKRKQAIKLPDWSFVFVGNLNPSINEEDLERTFKHCGKITSIIIRTSSGRVAIVKPGQYKPSSADRQYATIQFTEPKAAKRAQRLNGTNVNGRRVVVCFNAVDLPEMQHLIKGHMNDNEPELRGKVDWRTYLKAVKTVVSKKVAVDRTFDAGVNPESSVKSDGNIRRELKIPRPLKKEMTFPQTIM
ncbi:hypothetical protein B0H21DRAFT_717715 [Amylocystis lapponica]|nr:hypothetical protein B0H21DRAFT_717715 [Amylocystis lapponica]